MATATCAIQRALSIIFWRRLLILAQVSDWRGNSPTPKARPRRNAIVAVASDLLWRRHHWKTLLLTLTVFAIKNAKGFVIAITLFLSIRWRATMPFCKLRAQLLTKTAIQRGEGSGGGSVERLRIRNSYVPRRPQSR